MTFGLILITLIVIIIFTTVAALFARYKKCPSDKILVVYGKVAKVDGQHQSSKCIHGGAAFIWPVIQAYHFLDLTPLSIEVNLRNALSKQNIRVDVPSRFTVGISTEPGIMQNAAERLLGLQLAEIQELSKDIIFGQLRLVIATMDIEEINTDRDKFLANVTANVEAELKKIGLRLINVNVTDINDESGYIQALGKEAAAKAVNDAKKSVAEQDRDGSIGEANAQRDQRIQVAQANAAAVEGRTCRRSPSRSRRRSAARSRPSPTGSRKLRRRCRRPRRWKSRTRRRRRPNLPAPGARRPLRRPTCWCTPESRRRESRFGPTPTPRRCAGRRRARPTPSSRR